MTTSTAITYHSEIGATGRVDTIEVSSGQELSDYVGREIGQTGTWVRISMARVDAERLGLFRSELGLDMLPADTMTGGVVVHELR